MSSEHITVAVRIRPLATSEKQLRKKRRQTLFDIPKDDQDLDRTLTILDSNVILFDSRKRDGKRQYGFDVVLNEDSTQTQVFEHTSKPLIKHVLQGYNATVFAYGATGCGKTFTITGTEENPGIIYQTMNELYNQIDLLSKDYIIETSVSYLEVYNENIRDLFARNPNQSLDLREDDSRVMVAGLSEIQPKDLDHMMKLLIRGNEQRSQAFTQANANSSRSHAVLQIHVRQKARVPMGDDEIKIATLSIIDLAGSERASVTNNRGERLQEGANINRSLLALGNCINALCSEKPNHVPFRNSKLTRLLKYSLTGNCKVVMIANVSPALVHSEETHNTLKYANRAKEIKTRAVQNTINVESQIAQYPKIIESLRAEINRLREELSHAGNSSDIPLEALNDAVIKSKPVYQKLKGKSATLSEYEAEISLNEQRIDHIRGILVAITNKIKLEEQRSLNGSILKLNEIMDHLHNANVNIWHNADQCRSAIDRYQEQLDTLKSTGCPDSLSSKFELLFKEATLEFEFESLEKQKEIMKTFQEKSKKESKEILDLNLEFFSLLLTGDCSLDQVFDQFAEKLSSSYLQSEPQSIELEYDTCTDDNHSDATYTEKLSELQVSEVETLPMVSFEKTPKRIAPMEHHTPEQLGAIDMDATPVARKRVKNTPGTTSKATPKVKKTPSRRKMRMSMIPVLRSSTEPMFLRSRSNK